MNNYSLKFLIEMTSFPIELLENGDLVSRSLFRPRMLSGQDEFVWKNIFEFPSDAGRAESVIWRKYAVSDLEAHDIGQLIARYKTETKPDFSYAGFLTAEAGRIRGSTTKRGHKFELMHAPNEGRWHVHVYVVSPEGVAVNG